MCMSSAHHWLLAVTVQHTKLQVLPARQDQYYYSYDVKYCLSVWHVRASKCSKSCLFGMLLSFGKGILEGVKRSTYMDYTKLLTQTRLLNTGAQCHACDSWKCSYIIVLNLFVLFLLHVYTVRCTCLSAGWAKPRLKSNLTINILWE